MGSEIRTVLDAIAGSWLPKAAIIAFGLSVLFAFAVAATQNAYNQNAYKWTDRDPPEGIASIDVWKLGMVTGTVGTATAFLVTLYVADRNYLRGREHIPSLTMKLQLARVAASQSYDAVIATLDAKNTGTGRCRVDRVYWTLKALSPYDDETVEEIRRDFESEPDNEQDVEFPWQEVRAAQVPEGIVVEPNESEQLTYDFIIPAEISAIVVSAWVANASEPKHVEGWYRRTVHLGQEG